MCTKCKVDPLNRICTRARQAFTAPHAPLSSVKFLLNFLTSNKSILKQKSKYLNSIRVFSFLHLIFQLKLNKQEIFGRRRKNGQEQLPQPATLFKKRLCLSCFPVNFAKFPRILFRTEYFQCQLLKNGKL